MKFLVLLIVAIGAAILFFTFSENLRNVVGGFSPEPPPTNAPQPGTRTTSGTASKPSNENRASGTPNGNGFYGPVGEPGAGFIGPKANPPNY